MIVKHALMSLFLVQLGCSATGNLGSTDGGHDAGDDSRCNRANCQAMVSSCRVQFAGEPGGSGSASSCSNVGPRPAGFDSVQYCPAICNAVGGGAMAQCLSDQQSVCDSGDAGVVLTSLCATASLGSAHGSQACQDSCDADLTTCNDRCTGGRACRDCRFTGSDGGCVGACPDGGFEGCMSCSFECGLAYGACLRGC